jgi:hypothetical protein
MGSSHRDIHPPLRIHFIDLAQYRAARECADRERLSLEAFVLKAIDEKMLVTRRVRLPRLQKNKRGRPAEPKPLEPMPASVKLPQPLAVTTSPSTVQAGPLCPRCHVEMTVMPNEKAQCPRCTRILAIETI